MAETMQFDLVCPEKSLASFAATQIVLPGSEGEMTAMPNHAPVITTLRPGIVVARSEKDEVEFIVTQGIVEIRPESVSVIAEHAFARADVTREILEQVLAQARAHAEAAELDEKHGAEKFVADMVHFLEMMG